MYVYHDLPGHAVAACTEAKFCDDTENTYGRAVVKILQYLLRTKDGHMRRKKTGRVKMLTYVNI